MTTAESPVLVGLRLTPMPGFVLETDTTEKVAGPIPGAPPTVEHVRGYRAATGERLVIFAWEGPPVRDRGPMVAAESWSATVGGEPATVTSTRAFFGQEQRVLVAHFGGPKPRQNRYMIYTTRLDKDAFAAMLASARFVDR